MPPAKSPAPVETHRYAMPVVREIDAPAPRPRPSQRQLVIASVLRCDRDDPAHRRRART